MADEDPEIYLYFLHTSGLKVHWRGDPAKREETIKWAEAHGYTLRNEDEDD